MYVGKVFFVQKKINKILLTNLEIFVQRRTQRYLKKTYISNNKNILSSTLFNKSALDPRLCYKSNSMQMFSPLRRVGWSLMSQSINQNIYFYVPCPICLKNMLQATSSGRRLTLSKWMERLEEGDGGQNTLIKLHSVLKLKSQFRNTPN